MVGKPGLAPGFVGGYVAVGGTFGKLTVISGGFIGGLVAGALARFICHVDPSNQSTSST
ncbi:hypothetical protein ACLKMH_19010 [Psychromonas sp. KJ10-10]|uniref:hypothetical protein n=1 Tax=Psychromonas sp. KJ10-10 TaxID=3391823 RepID=UPI0039B54C30